MFFELTTIKNEEKFLINLSCLIFIARTKNGCCLHTIDGDTFYVKETYDYLVDMCRCANEAGKS